MGDPFGRFGGFGALGSSLFGTKDTCDDPFFSQPFEDLLGPNSFSSGSQKSNGGKGVTIEELLSDEEVDEGKNSGDEKHPISGKQPSVEHPEDDVDAERKIQDVNKSGDFNRMEGTQSQAYTFRYHTCKVTYGGIDGAYYTSSRIRRADSNGVLLEETKEADKTSGQATHRISRGIHDKGHSLTRKLNFDGKVDTSQTLHNLNEDELGGFEEAWKGNVIGRLPPGWTDESNMHETTGFNSGEPKRETGWGGLLLPWQTRRGPDGKRGGPSTSGPGAKKVVRIDIK